MRASIVEAGGGIVINNSLVDGERVRDHEVIPDGEEISLGWIPDQQDDLLVWQRIDQNGSVTLGPLRIQDGCQGRVFGLALASAPELQRNLVVWAIDADI